MVATTTRLNTPGPELARIAGVHAMTDVTGFGIAGHALEMARGSGCSIRIDRSSIPYLPEAQSLVQSGFVTGASGRNWDSYGDRVDLGDASPTEKALLTDPQTSGGLLVACAPDAADTVLDCFRRHGFEQAAVIGSAVEGDGSLTII